MDPNDQRIAIAKALGWKPFDWKEPDGTCSGWIDTKGRRYYSECPEEMPDYLSDLNAMHEAELWLDSQNLYADYMMELGDITDGNTVVAHWFEDSTGRTCVMLATAFQRAEAFLRTLNLWTDQPTSL